jgi:CDP-glycerol glycerophosphotransferase
MTIVVGRSFSVFSDNAKYFFAAHTQSKSPGERVVYLTVCESLREEIEEAGGDAIVHPSVESWGYLLRCGNVVTDSAEWIEKGVYQFSYGARRVQLWHGAPLKHIELDVHERRTQRMGFVPRILLNLQKWATSRYLLYDEVVATSPQVISACFESAFRAKSFSDTGYPRNDILLQIPPAGSIAASLMALNVDHEAIARVKASKAQSQMICLYMPTFRSHHQDPFAREIALERLSRFALDNGIFFILKLHPVMAGKYQIESYPGLIEYGAAQDVYPLVYLCDVLITDYSSIYFDYLLLDRPIVFFDYDLDEYLLNERAMYFDYMDMTPGEHCKDIGSLERTLERITLNGYDDGFAEERRKVRDFTHRHQDSGASARVLELIRTKI